MPVFAVRQYFSLVINPALRGFLATAVTETRFTGLTDHFAMGAGWVFTGVMHTAHQISTTGQHFGYVFYFHITELMASVNQVGEEFIFGQYLFELTENDRCEGMSVNDAARR